MIRRLLFLPALFLFFSFAAISQNKATAKYGNVTAKDFANKTYAVDSNANAVVIADIGSCELVGNSKMNFSLSFKQFRRVHILNKNRYDIANVSIPLYSLNGSEDKLDRLKAATYNLENGEVVKTELEAKTSVLKILEGKIIYYRYFEQYRNRYPAVDYAEIVKFFERVNKADQNRIVLVRKEPVQKAF